MKTSLVPVLVVTSLFVAGFASADDDGGTPPPLAPRVEGPQIRSRSLVYGGLASTASGAALLIAGASITAAETPPPPPGCTINHTLAGSLCGLSTSWVRSEYAAQQTLGTSLLVLGGAATATGLVLIAVGGQPREPTPSSMPELAVGPKSATARWTF